MFKDYYRILGIESSATKVEIKRAYREMSMKWHPDRNPDADVTSIMQDINEAYAILKDETKKSRYDIEYERFCKEFADAKTQESAFKNEQKETPKESRSYNYDVKDDSLNEDIKNARKYAKSLVDEFLQSLKESSVAAAKGAASNAANYAIGWIVGGIALSLIGILIKSCS